MKPTKHLLPALSGIILASAPFASAATLAINVGANSTIRTDLANQSSSAILFAGDVNSATDDFLRSALAFDLSNPLLSGATINSATVTFTTRGNDTSSANATITLSLHQLTSSFTESGVTWISRDGTTNWTSAGGDFGTSLATASGNPRTIGADAEMDFTSTSLASTVQGVIGGNLYLLLKSTTEDSTLRNVFQFDSTRAVATGGVAPVLTLDYTAAPIPEPSAALLGGLGLLALLRRRR